MNIEQEKVVEESSIDWKKLFFVSLFLGFTGLGRFLAGRKISGAIKFLTMIMAGVMMSLMESKVIGPIAFIPLVGVFLWWYIDLLLLASGRFIDSYGRRVTNTTTQRYVSLSFLIIYGAVSLLGSIAGVLTDKSEQARQEAQAQEKDSYKWYSASQSEFTVNTAKELIEFANLVNSGNNFEGKTVKLGASIRLNNIENLSDWMTKPPANKWTPIGTKDNPFAGTFDGSGYDISGVYVKSNLCAGLFCSSKTEGIIKNLGMTNSYIEGIEGFAGGLVGMNGGTIINGRCYLCNVVGMATPATAVSITGGLVGNNAGTIIDSYYYGNVAEFGELSNVVGYVGGLVGINVALGTGSGTISGSYFFGMMSINVKNGGIYVGGLAGTNMNNINNSYSIIGNLDGSGKISAGGLVGINQKGIINNCYSVSISNGGRAGGLVGAKENSSGKITGSYFNKSVSFDNGLGIGKTTEQMKQKKTFAGWDFNKIWGITDEINSGYPYLLKNEARK